MRRQCILPACLLVLGSLSAVAQDLATIVGTVSDPSGAVVSGVAITVSNPEKGFRRLYASESAGAYVAAHVPLGTYTLTVTAPGFEKVVHSGITLDAGQTQRVDVQLTVGSQQQQVQVVANVPKVETETGAISHVITGAQVSELNIPDRNFANLALLIPGAAPGAAPSAGGFDPNTVGDIATDTLPINGLPGNMNNREIDGTNDVDQGSGSDSLQVLPSLDSIAEFRISTSNYSAEYAKSGSGIIEVVTKSGTNKFHGTAFEFVRNDAMDANNWFLNRAIGGGAPKLPLKKNDFGFTIGGPLFISKRFCIRRPITNAAYRGRNLLLPDGYEAMLDLRGAHFGRYRLYGGALRRGADCRRLGNTMQMTGSMLRSGKWFAPDDDTGFAHRASPRSQGFSAESFGGRPVIGVCNSWSELNNCNVHLREVADAVKRGVWAAGGFPLEFMTISLGEELTMPTTMLYRDLMAMDVEEMIRSNPLDGVALLCGCDKTTPAQLMGACSMDVPSIMAPVGPMLTGRYNQELGSGTALWKFWDERRAGRLDEKQWSELEGCYSRSAGTCNTMGTASTMTALEEALGMSLPGAASIPAVMAALLPPLDGDAPTVTGETLAENVMGAECHNSDVIHSLDQPFHAAGSLVVLRSSLAPRGAMVKTSAASPHLLQHAGPAVVFKNYEDMLARVDDPGLEVEESSVLVLKSAGPVGAPGMPESGMIPIPAKLLRRGVQDMVRISDARMSGTSFGAIVLHVAPEAAVGGPLAAVATGDIIKLDIPNRTLDLLIPEQELAEGQKRSPAPSRRWSRGYYSMFTEHVPQADEGCDFDFLRANEADKPYEPEIGRSYRARRRHRQECFSMIRTQRDKCLNSPLAYQ